MMTDDVSSASSETKNIKKVGLDMPSHSGKIQATSTADNVRTGDISLPKSKNISKGTQEMPILQKDKSLKNDSLTKDKNLSSGDNSPSKDKLLSKGENSDDILFFQEENTENSVINTSSFILSDMERKYFDFLRIHL